MKKILVVFSTVLALSILAITAQENAGGKKTETAGATKAGATSEHKILSPDQVQRGETPPGLPAGAQMAVLDGNPAQKGSFTVRLKMP
ncbi:MAG TPA: hypothetical protein VFO30_05135 [Chthoniobacterales bacterium]|nr:hypothetical protein [Chthoniobacterales bacterium]